LAKHLIFHTFKPTHHAPARFKWAEYCGNHRQKQAFSHKNVRHISAGEKACWARERAKPVYLF
jgi:hypothetical protein